MKKRTVFILLTLMAVFCLGFSSLAASVSSEKGELDRIEQEKKKAEEKLKELEKSKGNLEEYIEELDQELNSIYASLDELDGQIEQKQAQIDEAKESLSQANQEKDKQYEAMKLRIQYMYEKGDTEFLDIILGSSSLAEMLNQVEYVAAISQYDRDMLDEYAALCDGIAQKEAALSSELEELKALKVEQEAKQVSLETMVEAKAEEVEKYEAQIDQVNGEVLDYEEEIGEQKARIESMEASIEASIAESKAVEESERAAEESRRAEESSRAEESRKESEANETGDSTESSAAESESESESTQESTQDGSSEKWIWPVPSSTNITSKYGKRTDPVTGELGKMHNGVDIGAKEGQDIVAVADGTVTVAGYTSINGNYVKVYHGDGTTTAYCHCSKLNVSVGDKVTQGQVIAQIGSTGKATGPHLHFAVIVDGNYLDPLDYVSP